MKNTKGKGQKTMEIAVKSFKEILTPVLQVVLDFFAIFADKAAECISDLAEKGKKCLSKWSETSWKEKLHPYAKTILWISATVAVISALCVLLSKKKS